MIPKTTLYYTLKNKVAATMSTLQIHEYDNKKLSKDSTNMVKLKKQLDRIYEQILNHEEKLKELHKKYNCKKEVIKQQYSTEFIREYCDNHETKVGDVIKTKNDRYMVDFNGNNTRIKPYLLKNKLVYGPLSYKSLEGVKDPISFLQPLKEQTNLAVFKIRTSHEWIEHFNISYIQSLTYVVVVYDFHKKIMLFQERKDADLRYIWKSMGKIKKNRFVHDYEDDEDEWVYYEDVLNYYNQ